ncbi:MAG: hypothetical protein IK114_00705 [Fibrobacter sp.]|nr:hypothetical protein [Fibrobacter sp.]
MKRTVNIVFACVLLLAGFALADIGFKCEMLPGGLDEVSCDIAQDTPIPSLNTKTYNVYKTWYAFQKAFIADVESKVKLATGNVYIHFETDIDLGGYSATENKCVNDDFSPLDFSSIPTTGEIYVDGDNNVIKNFCYIVEGVYASFFGDLTNIHVSNLAFDSAYVMAKFETSTSTNAMAAVVADRAENTMFENVKVSNSKVYGWNTAAVTYSAKNASFSNIQVDGVFLSLSEEVLKNCSNYKDLSKKVSYSGGVVAYLNEYAKFEKISVSNLTIPDSVSLILQRVKADHEIAYNAGGIIGGVSVVMGTGQTSFSLQECAVSAEISGSTVGGLIGSVSATTITDKSKFEVANAVVSLKSGDYNGADKYHYVGGLVGALSWKNGEAELSKNKVDISVKNMDLNIAPGGSYIGGLVGVFTGLADDKSSSVDLNIDGNEVRAEITASEKSLIVGGFLGHASFSPSNSTLTIKNSTVKSINPDVNPNVITSPTAKLDVIRAAYGVGSIANPDGNVEISENHAEGNINIAATSVSHTSAVGGMVGLATIHELNVCNNTSVGDLLAETKKENSDDPTLHLGYIAGVIAKQSMSGISLANANYHYGTKDANAVLAVDSLYEEKLGGAVSDWKISGATTPYNIRFNYRNAVKGLGAEGTLDIDGYGYIYEESGNQWLYDGVIDGDAMKSRLFTYVLNHVSAGTKECSENGAVCWENETDSLPKISEWRTVYKVAIDLDEIWDKLSDADKDSLKENLTGTKDGKHHSAVSYTENYSALNYDFVRKINELSVISGVFDKDIEVDLYNLYKNGNYSLTAKEVDYQKVYLDVNTASKEVFYALDSEISDSLVVPNSLKWVVLPSMIYTAEACVAGWSFNADTSDYAYHVSHQGEYIYRDINAEKTLYAVWWNAEQCVNGHYNRVRLESEHGSIAVDEYRDGSKVYTHHFAKDSTMLLSMGMLGRVAMLVHAESDSGYRFDSLVVADLDTVFFDGDTLPEHMKDVSMKAYFSKSKGEKNQGEKDLVRGELCKRGNAVGVYFATGKPKGIVEDVQVSLMDALGVELDVSTLMVDSVGYRPYFALIPGNYMVRASLKASGKLILDTAFTVESEIKVEKDSWKMLALSDVDTSALDWNGDQLLYWWDESTTFGDYWKYQKYRGENADATQGFWYNSLEGRALPLRKDVAMVGHEIVWELDSGWNMMANPYGWDVTLRHEAISMDVNDSIVVWTWLGENAGYEINIGLDSYEAAWVYSNKERTLKIGAEDYFETWLPLNGEQGGALPKKRGGRVLAKASAHNNWTLQAVLADAAGHEDSWNVLGVGTVAELYEPPEGMGDHVNLSVVSGEKALAKSVVAPKSGADGYSWQVALSASSDRVGYLKFEGLADLAGLGYRVYVTYEGETREVPSGDSLRVMLKAKGAVATVQVTTSEIRTIASKLENLQFARLPGALQVGFDVSSDLAGTPYKVQLVGINGKVAATYRGKSTAGRNTLALTAPKPGLYLLRVTVGGHHAARKVAIYR